MKWALVNAQRALNAETTSDQRQYCNVASMLMRRHVNATCPLGNGRKRMKWHTNDWIFLILKACICKIWNPLYDISQQAHDVYATSMQRHDVASTLRRRYINVMCLLGYIFCLSSTIKICSDMIFFFQNLYKSLSTYESSFHTFTWIFLDIFVKKYISSSTSCIWQFLTNYILGITKTLP